MISTNLSFSERAPFFLSKGRERARIVKFLGKDIDDWIESDSYNKLHQHRREGDRIVLYYNHNAEKIVLAVKIGDDLSAPPYSIKDGPIIEESMFEPKESLPNSGVIPITLENLKILQEQDVLNEEEVYVLLANKKNPGFRL